MLEQEASRATGSARAGGAHRAWPRGPRPRAVTPEYWEVLDLQETTWSIEQIGPESWEASAGSSRRESRAHSSQVPALVNPGLG